MGCWLCKEGQGFLSWPKQCTHFSVPTNALVWWSTLTVYHTLLPLLNEVMFFFRCVHESTSRYSNLLLFVYRFWVHPLMLTVNRSSCVRSMKPCYSTQALTSHSAIWSWVMWKLFKRAYHEITTASESQSIDGPIQGRTRPSWTVQISEVTPRWTLVWSIDLMFFNRFVQVPAYSPLYIKASHSQTGGGSLYSLH